MKSILYVGATLMIGASIYGFVDYEKTKNKKEFTNMYKETTLAEPVIVPVSSKNNKEERKDILVNKKDKTVKSQKIKNNNPVENNGESIEVTTPVPKEEKLITKEVKIDIPEVTVAPTKDNVSDKVVTHKKRKLSTKLFSRGALDDRYIDEEIKKPETKKNKK
ncbi:MAG: hypothetical protein ACRDEB_02535 [Chitinophagaceae bacterium]